MSMFLFLKNKSIIKSGIFKNILLVFVSLVLTIFSISLGFYLTEKYFFDKILYKKSALHGYGENDWASPLIEPQSNILKKRKLAINNLLTDITEDEVLQLSREQNNSQRENTMCLLPFTIKTTDDRTYGSEVGELQMLTTISREKLLKKHNALLYNIEKYFFDKILYKKSALRGYGENDWASPLIEPQSNSLKKRKLAIKNICSSPFVIVVIGDSMAYGTGVRESQTFPILLQEKLQKKYNVLVYNLSLPGDHIIDNYAKYLLAKEKLHPDLFIFGVVNNDLVIDYSGKYKNSKLIDEFRKKCDGTEYPVTKEKYWEKMSYDNIISQIFFLTVLDKSCNYQYLHYFLEKIQVDRHKIIFMTYYRTKEINKNDLEMLREKWLNIIDESRDKNLFVLQKYRQKILSMGFPYLAPSDPYDLVSGSEGHPSATMHKKYSEMLSETVEKYIKNYHCSLDR